jgi:DNA primase
MSHTNLFDEVKRHFEIVSFISQYIKLKKVGKNYVGLCPFHAERTPSFTVNGEKQIFKCFGCGASGDVVSFYMRIKGLEFKDALIELAEKAGLRIDQRAFTEKRKEKDLVEVNFKVAKIYQHYLWNSPLSERARAYLKSRNLSEECAKTFYLGYAPSEGRFLASMLRTQKIDLDLAVSAGLLKKGEDGSYFDLFRDRLMFPIFNEKGECLGFGGRALGPEAEPKYLNTPESRIFKKSEILYGLFQSKDYIKKEGKVFLVEGYFDFLSLWERGLRNVVATCGTALTEKHIQKLKPLADDFYLLYDGDIAGAKASLRALSMFLKEGVFPQIISLPEGEDPDSFAQKFLNDPEEFKRELSKFLKEATAFVFEFYRLEYQKNPSKVFNEVLELFQGISDPVLLQRLKRELAYYFQVSESDIEKKLRRPMQREVTPQLESQLTREECFIKNIAQYLVNFPEDIPELESAGLKKLLQENFSSGIYHQFLMKILELKAEGYTSFLEVPEPSFQEILGDLLFSPPFEDRKQALEDIKRFIGVELQKREILKIAERLKLLQRAGKKEEVESYLPQINSKLRLCKDLKKH